MGRIIEQSILDYVNDKFSINIPHPALVTLLCIKGRTGEGFTFSEAGEERCPIASPFSLTRITKGLIENEEGKRKRK